MEESNPGYAKEQYLPKEEFLSDVAEAGKWLGIKEKEIEAQQELLEEIYEYDNGVEKPKREVEVPIYLFQTAEWIDGKYKEYTGKKAVGVAKWAARAASTGLGFTGTVTAAVNPAIGIPLQCASTAPIVAYEGYKKYLKNKFEDEEPLAAKAKELGTDKYCNKLGLSMAYMKLGMEALENRSKYTEPRAS